MEPSIEDGYVSIDVEEDEIPNKPSQIGKLHIAPETLPTPPYHTLLEGLQLPRMFVGMLQAEGFVRCSSEPPCAPTPVSGLEARCCGLGRSPRDHPEALLLGKVAWRAQGRAYSR